MVLVFRADGRSSRVEVKDIPKTTMSSKNIYIRSECRHCSERAPHSDHTSLSPLTLNSMRISLLLASAVTALAASPSVSDQALLDHLSPSALKTCDDTLAPAKMYRLEFNSGQYFAPETSTVQIVKFFCKYLDDLGGGAVFHGAAPYTVDGSLMRFYLDAGHTVNAFSYVVFPPTPQGAYNCKLHWSLARTSEVFSSSMHPMKLDVRVAPALTDPSFLAVYSGWEPSIFGTIGGEPPQNVVVNEIECKNAGNGLGLAFAFNAGHEIDTPDALFNYVVTVAPGHDGPYLTYERDC